MIKSIVRKILPNPFEKLINKASYKKNRTFLLVWNRGLGDIALGLYAIVYRIKKDIPNAEITFITREDLKEGFKLLKDAKVITTSLLKRGASFSLKDIAERLQLSLSDFDVIIKHPDPTYWVKWQLGSLQPKLCWQKEWDKLALSLPALEKNKLIGVHVHSETSYGYEKNWSFEKWNTLFQQLERKGYTCLLLGKKATKTFSYKNIIDLRGETTLLELLATLKNHCSYFIGPDSGILSLLYFLDENFTMKAISIWADSNQGILKQQVASPNPGLTHIPLIAQDGDLSLLSVDEVLNHL